MAAHRYWRIHSYANDIVGATTVAELELRASEGGGDETGSGTPSASNVGFGAAANAFDNDTGTFWGATTSLDEWLAYDFGDGNDVDIVEVAITARSGSYWTQCPGSFSLDYSDDGTNWTRKYFFKLLHYTDGEQKVLNSAHSESLDNPTGSYRYFRIMSLMSTGGGQTNASEIQLWETIGGSDQTGSGTPTADSEYGATWSPDKAFDDNTSTMWVSTTIPFDHWIKYDFGAGNDKTIIGVSWKVRIDGYTGEAPRVFLFQVSDDDSTWLTVFHALVEPAWASGELREFGILPLADCYHLHDAELGLSDPLFLADLDAYHPHDAETVLAFGITLSAIECYHLHDADLCNVVEVGMHYLLHADAGEDYLLHDADACELIHTLAAEDCYHLHDADSIVLPWVHNAYHLHDGETVPSLGITLSVADCYHLHDADSPYLIVWLAVNPCDNLHFADDPAIGVILIVAWNYHTHGPPGPIQVWTSYDIVMFENFPILHYADNVPLDPELYYDLNVPYVHHEIWDDFYLIIPLIGIAEDYLLHDAESIPLLQRHDLSVEPCFHLHDVDAPPLTEHHILADCDCVHLVTTQDADLVVFLDIDESDHLHFSETIPLGIHIVPDDSYHLLVDDALDLVVQLAIAGDYLAHVAEDFAVAQLHYLKLGSALDNYHVLVSDNVVWPYLSKNLGALKIINLETERVVENVGTRRHAIFWEAA
jgi:hypothetical protein